jgi:hypothetical protein
MARPAQNLLPEPQSEFFNRLDCFWNSLDSLQRGSFRRHVYLVREVARVPSCS